jgi:cobalt-zinc-cadmium efflux system outer membrane protein
MKDKIQTLTVSIFTIILILSSNLCASNSWQSPFDTAAPDVKSVDTILTLKDIFKLVAAYNPTFQSLDLQIKAARDNLKQAGLWSNPELEAEFEEVSWDAPGFGESEFTISLTQEFELFGQPGARKKVAIAHINATKLQARLSTFDLYLETKLRFYVLAHAQNNVILSQKSVELAQEIVEDINDQLNRGAALHSELLLATLEEQKALLALSQAKRDVISVEEALVSLWTGKPSDLKISIETKPDFSYILDKLAGFSNHVDSARDVIQKQNELKILQAEKTRAIAEARPAVTLTGGVKRFDADNSKSFLFGVSMPIPFFNRNQGTRQSLDAQLNSLKYELERSKIESLSNIQSQTIKVKMLIDKYTALDSLLLPTAEEVYQTLKSAYEAGRVPFTQLLEAERILNNLNFESNDILLNIHEQIIGLESLTGVVLLFDRKD